MPGHSVRCSHKAQTSTLGVSAYDRAASLLASLLMIIGGVVVLLFIAWVSTKVFHSEHGTPVPVAFVDVGGGHKNGEGVAGMEIAAPAESELAGDGDTRNDDPVEALAAIVEAAVVPATDLDRLDEKLKRAEKWIGNGPSTGRGTKAPAGGSGGGDGGGVNVSDRVARWEIRFPEGNSVESYARQLDAFEIELGLLAPESEILYLSNLAAKAPTKRTGPRASELRQAMLWSRTELIEADIELCRRAGIEVGGRPILKFLPKKTTAQLAQLEQDYKHRSVKEIRRTRFGVKPDGDTFVFYVIDQTYF